MGPSLIPDQINIEGQLSLNEIRLFHELNDKDISEEEVKDVMEFTNSLRTESNAHWEPPQPSSDSIVWRYLDFTQFMSILERKSIWFSNIAQFEDPYEGTIPYKNIQNEINQIVDETGVDVDIAKTVHKSLTSGYKYKSDGFVNCWNLNNHESAALWEQYIKSTEGVAISTTVDRLERSLEDSGKELKFGNVEYIDYKNKTIQDGILPTLYHKRMSFEHENEFRISFLNEGDDKIGSGTYLPVDTDILFDKVYLAPTSKEWFYDQVERVLHTYNIDCKLVQSDILSDPVY